MRAIATAAKGKGVTNTVRRVREIGAHYGIRPDSMERRIAAVLKLVEQSGCRATLPITGVVVARHPGAVIEYAAHGIEFPVHGYYHVDHKALPEHRQLSQLARARHAFEARGLPVAGFRAPYLRWNDATLRAVRENGFLYDCSQAMHLAVVESETNAYRRGLDFCGAMAAYEHPVVPRYEQGILRLPYVLPDDESMVDRLGITSPQAIADLWLAMFRATHRRGELFTLAAHPERIDICKPGIVAVLEAARSVSPPVWIARHEEIARWWRDRRDATVTVNDAGRGRMCFTIRGPVGLTILARSLGVPEPEPWADRYDRVRAMHFDLDVEKRPFIGVHPSTPASLAMFLREQGYVVEISSARSEYAHYVEHGRFERLDELRLLNEIEAGSSPLLRLGRWPHGARSALSITGDIDALTIRDYVFRLVRH